MSPKPYPFGPPPPPPTPATEADPKVYSASEMLEYGKVCYIHGWKLGQATEVGISDPENISPDSTTSNPATDSPTKEDL